MAPQDPEWLERMYNNRARVPEHPAYFARWAAESARVRTGQPCSIDLAYGDGPNETLDVFPAERPDAPVLVFIHGGYWRALDKSDHSFIAPAFTRNDVCVVVPNYALCPGSESAPVTIPDIALQMAKALDWVWRHAARHGGDPRRITVAGHSAGGHLAAMLLGCRWKRVAPDLPAQLVRNALSISGIFDLEPMRFTPSFQTSLRLTPADVRRASPARWPAPAAGCLYSVVGANESEEFIRQNGLIEKAWGPGIVQMCEQVPGRDHFSVLDAFADPTHKLHGQAMALVRG